MRKRGPVGLETSVSRRDVIVATSGMAFALLLGAGGITAMNARRVSDGKVASVGAWVTVNSNGEILIYNPVAEMGQGSMTALPLILAEEMDADWSKVRIEHSPIEPAIYGRGVRRRYMVTAGSMAVSGYFESLRIAGAKIRKVLLQNAASRLEVPISELTTQPSLVVHEGTGRRLSYGDVAHASKIPEPLPEVDPSELKSPEKFRLIGHSKPRHDISAKTDGSAIYGIDVQVPEMRYGMIVRSPVHGSKPVRYNAPEVQAAPGIVTTVPLEHGIGIVGETIQSVFKAREILEIDWAKGAQAEAFDSETALEEYADISESGTIPSRVILEHGNASVAFENAAGVYQADFLADYVYHAQMEPLNAVVSVSKSGDRAEVWAGTQDPSGARSSVAQALGIDVAKVKFNPCYLGGGFGRRTNPDYILEATHLSNAIKQPVKLIWTREDDLQYGQFRPMCLQRLRVAIDREGIVRGWTHCVLGDGGNMLASGIRIPYYDIPNQSLEVCSVSHGIRVKDWRSIGHGYNKFAIEGFVDEIAQQQGEDAYKFRRKLLSKSAKALRVLDTVAEMGKWGQKSPDGRAKGLAFSERSGSFAAGVAEISLDAESGKITVHRFWCAVDGGIIIQPDNARAQVEGGIVMGLSSVLLERITIKDGAVQQFNYYDYPILRMSETPEIAVKFVNSNEAPTGIGEVSLPVVGGAVANAFAALTGKRLRHLPFTQNRVTSALRSGVKL